MKCFSILSFELIVRVSLSQTAFNMGEHRDQVFQDGAEGKICPFTCFCFRRYYMFVQSLILPVVYDWELFGC